ncbi:MAG: dethiobiotin synthase [Planctomycetota bacterium]
MKPLSYFITGTDTGIGKSVVTAGICRILRSKGYDIGVMKPVSTGGRDDAIFLKRQTGLNDSLDLINPYYFRHPIAPLFAAQLEHKSINISKILSAYRKLKQSHQGIIVEGAGGLLVPLKQNYLMADLIRDMRLPLIIVARPTLGTINHTLLTINSARQYKVKIKGFIVNYYDKNIKKGWTEKSSPVVIERISGVRCLGEIPYISTINKGVIPYKPFVSVLKELMD